MPRLKKKDFAFLIKSVKGRISKLRNKNRDVKFNLTANYLRTQWEAQDGYCPCCGIGMDLKGKTHRKGVSPDMRASVDRIDHKKGYVRGNIALLHQCCNRFKGQLDGNTMYSIAKRIVERFEQTYPGVRIRIDAELKETVDGRQHPFPRYSYEASGGIHFGGEGDSVAKVDIAHPH